MTRSAPQRPLSWASPEVVTERGTQSPAVASSCAQQYARMAVGFTGSAAVSAVSHAFRSRMVRSAEARTP
ncbi:hypothetical protein ACFQ0G_15610 [Streptomyces chiangmaiensis]